MKLALTRYRKMWSMCDYRSPSFKSQLSIDSLSDNVMENSYAIDFPPVPSFLVAPCAHVLMVLRAINICLINIRGGAQLQTFKDSERRTRTAFSLDTFVFTLFV